MVRLLYIAIPISLLACSGNDEIVPETITSSEFYFPSSTNENWATIIPEELDWNVNRLDELYNHLESNNTRAFIILKDGKIAVEKYWGNNILNTAPFDQSSRWYWASAGKTVTAFLVGIAQEKGLLNIEDKTSDYLGENWTSMPQEKEKLITVGHQLTMTTGLDYTVDDVDCTDPSCLDFKADAGTQWFYHNAAYTLLEKVVSNVSGISYNQFTDDQLEMKIGMNGTWLKSGYNNVYWSIPRDAARFGLLILNEGKWNDLEIMTDKNYFDSMTNSSQELNPSYGYLWWLNGKESIIMPGLPISFKTSLSPPAPEDLFAAMGKNGQFVDVVPSRDLVVVRMGEAPDGSLVPVKFHNTMWEKIMDVIGEE